MPLGPKPRLALDANVLFDLADKREFALSALDLLREKGAILKTCPRVVMELSFEVKNPSSQEKVRRAKQAFVCLRYWGIEMLGLTEIQQTISHNFCYALRNSGMIPFEERNDCLILGEAAASGTIDYLLTSDQHLLSIEREYLHKLFAQHELNKVEIVSPRNFYQRIKNA